MRCLAVALLVSVLTSSSAAAATWYVDQAAAAGGDGTQTKPFRKINDANEVWVLGWSGRGRAAQARRR